MNRKIDEQRMNQSKEKTIDYVLHSIKAQPSRVFFTKVRLMISTSLIIVATLVVILLTPNNSGTDPIVLSAYEQEKIAEISYISSSLIGSNMILNSDNTMLLSANYIVDSSTTSFEDNDAQINVYFDTLKIFLEENIFNNSINIVVDEENPNHQTIRFTIDEIEYILIITFTDDTFTGTLEINSIIFDVSGKYEDTEEELKLVLEAVNGEDYVNIEFKTELKEDETESKYQIEHRFNNQVSNKEFKISTEQNEQKVEIIDGNDEYKLKKELEDGVFKYKLQYSINGVGGAAVITETDMGEYVYQVQEGNVSIEITKGRPEYSYNNPKGNGNPNSDDSEDDNPGQSGDNPGQSGDNPGNK